MSTQPDDAAHLVVSLILARATGDVEVRIEDRRNDCVTTLRCRVADAARLVGAQTMLQDPIRFSEDFRTAYWFGETIPLTPAQAKVIEVLWREYQKGTPDVAQDILLKATGTYQVKMSDVFKGSLAWGRLVIFPQRGFYRINDQPPATVAPSAVTEPMP
jgi:hypothetical protein